MLSDIHVVGKKIKAVSKIRLTSTNLSRSKKSNAFSRLVKTCKSVVMLKRLICKEIS